MSDAASCSRLCLGGVNASAHIDLAPRLLKQPIETFVRSKRIDGDRRVSFFGAGTSSAVSASASVISLLHRGVGSFAQSPSKFSRPGRSAVAVRRLRYGPSYQDFRLHWLLLCLVSRSLL